jgi:hypothetical protein
VYRGHRSHYLSMTNRVESYEQLRNDYVNISSHSRQGCHGDGQTDTSVRPSVTFDKALLHPLRNIRAYLSIFEHILENIQRICPLCPITNGHDRPSAHLSRPYTTSLLPHLSSMTTLIHVTVIF